MAHAQADKSYHKKNKQTRVRVGRKQKINFPKDFPQPANRKLGTIFLIKTDGMILYLKKLQT